MFPFEGDYSLVSSIFDVIKSVVNPQVLVYLAGWGKNWLKNKPNPSFTHYILSRRGDLGRSHALHFGESGILLEWADEEGWREINKMDV